MQKKSFSIIELALIVSLLWIVFSMTRNFFNIWRQNKIVFWEICLNYIFAEVDKFQTDIKYGKLPVSISWLDGVYSIRLYWANTWSFLSSSWMWWMKFQWLSNDYSTILTYKNISLTSNSFAPFNNVLIPDPCFDWWLTVVWTPSINSWSLQITIPIVKSNDTQRFVWENWATNLNPQITWEVIYSVCWLKRWLTNPTRWNLLDIGECLQIWKINIDKRSETINFIKCARTNDKTWICSLRPRLN